MIKKELKDKIIIRNYTNKSDTEIMEYMMPVIEHGEKTATNGKIKYNLLTQFTDGVIVYSTQRGNTTTFYIEE